MNNQRYQKFNYLNYYAIEVLERIGIRTPSQRQIDYVEFILSLCRKDLIRKLNR